MTTTPTMNRSLARLVWGLLITFSLWALPALAQDPVVDSADPPSAEQETYDLEVEIAGDNFGKDSDVDFFVSCDPSDPSCTPNDPGGIHVKKVKVLGPKKLKATIDVDAGATVDDFDIQVRSRGRTGKGIELFRVFEKPNQSDDPIPPGTVTDLTLGTTSFNWVRLSWTVPADDGDNPASGPASGFELWCGVQGEPRRRCDCRRYSGFWTWQPGATSRCEAHDHDPSFRPDTPYFFEVVYFDEEPNSSGWSNRVEGSTDPYVPDPSWAVEEVNIPLNVTLGHGFDSSGNPVIAGAFNERLRILTGAWTGTGWSWTSEDLADPVVFSSQWFGYPSVSFTMDPYGKPAFAVVQEVRNGKFAVLYTSFSQPQQQWVTETVVTLTKSRLEQLALAFDPDGQPAIAFGAWRDREPDAVLLYRRDGGGAWNLELEHACLADPFRGSVDLAFDPATGDLAVVYGVRLEGDLNPDQVEAGIWSVATDAWTFETVRPGPPDPPVFGVEGVNVIFDPGRGDFVTTFAQDLTANFCERSGGASPWQCSTVFRPAETAYDGNQLTIDGYSETFLTFAPTGDAVALARRPLGQSSWSIEDVDYIYSDAHSYPDGSGGVGQIHLALDPSDSPTLSWLWNIADGELASEHHYFAWKP